MKTLNHNAAMLSAFEAMNFMVKKAESQGQTVSVQEIMQEIVSNPKGNTAQYFKKLLTVGYDAIMDLAEK